MDEREALRDPAGVGDEDHEHPPGAELDELDVGNRRPCEGRVLHDRDLAGQLRQRAHCAHEDVVEVAWPVEEGEIAARCAGESGRTLGEVVDEDAVALVGGDAPGRGVRRRDELLVFEQGHVVADRRRRHPEGVPLDDRLAADGLTRVDEVLHDRPQHLQTSIGDHLASSRCPADWHSHDLSANSTGSHRS